MLRKLLLIFMLICVTKCEQSFSYSVENLYAIIDETAEYFKNLSNAYKGSNTDVIKNIDNVITKYMENATKTIHQRRKRSLQDNLESSKGVNVLQAFEEEISVDLPDFQDIVFFSIWDEDRLILFAAAVDSSNIFLHQLIDNKLQSVRTYPQTNGKRIIASTYGTDVLIIVQKYTDGIVILRLSKNKNGTYELHFKQEFEISGMVHMDMWLGMNQLYLGIASNTRVFIYVWLGEHFDKIDTLHFRAKKLLPFRNKSFVQIVAVGAVTKIFRFSVRSNKFVEAQVLHGARDATSFHFKEGHFEERFLLLAGNTSTILYKEMYDRFVPFQKFAAVDSVYSLTMGNTVVLLSVDGDTAKLYQYNGWRFFELHVTLSNVHQIRQIQLYGGDTLIVQNQSKQWNILKPIWTAKKTWRSMQNRIDNWCLKTRQSATQRDSVKIPDLKNPVKILNAHIAQLRVRNINGHNEDELIRLTQQYKKAIAKLDLTYSTLVQARAAEKPKYVVLHGKKIAVKCKGKCHVHRINTNATIKSVIKSEILKPITQILKFTNLKVKTVNNWKCPIPNFEIQDISVGKSINGIYMQTLREETLKISGDQEVSGEHKFSTLHATNVSMPLNIATNTTIQTVQMKEVKVKELHLTNGEFFLPLNANSTITMTGSITAAEVKITGLINLKSGIKGKAREKLAPLKEIPMPLTLFKDCFLQNVTFRNLIKVENIVRHRGLSLKEILQNSTSLNSNIPTHLILSSDKTRWDNVTLWNYNNWVTQRSTDTIIISGAKFASNNVVLTNATYENLPTPKLTVPLCATEIITPEIRTSSITMDNIVVQNLNVSHVIGAYDLNNSIFNPVSALRDIDFSTKLFTGPVFVKNISTSNIMGMDPEELKLHTNKWLDFNRLNGPVNVAKLVVGNLETPAVFNFSLPTKVRNVIIKANSNIGRINDVNILYFMENVMKVNDVMSLEEVTFAHGFKSNHLYTSHSTLNLSHLEAPVNLRSKRISGTLETNTINLPETFSYPTNNIPATFIIQGSATFLTEPIVQNVQNVNIKKLSEDLWMSNEDSVVSGSNININNMTILSDVVVYDSENPLNVKWWRSLSDRLLSKTKQQYITAALSFKNVEMLAVVAANNSILYSSDPNVKNLLTNSLMRNITQIVNAAWHFEELDIGNLDLDGKFNNINLNTDIVRYNAQQNIITGKKIITDLITKDLWSYDNNFSNWANNVLTQKAQKLSIIKGRKTFNDISLNNLSVKGAIMGRKIEEALLKSGNQTIYGINKLQGYINAPSLIIDSTVNDVNLTQLMKNQIKKHRPMQTVKTEIDFRNNLDIVGNITINGLYQGVALTNINNGQKKLDVLLNRTTKIMELTEDITIALQNRANYITKFEAINENALEIIPDFETENVIVLNSTCLCEPKNISLLCNDTRLLNIVTGTNSSTFILMKLVLLDNAIFVVIVESDFVSIYSYNSTEQQLLQKAGLYVPDILQVSVEPADNSLWIILQLPGQTLILHYEVWNELKQYILPLSDNFTTSTTPNNQLLLIRSDGMWNLGGAFYPQHVFKIALNGEIKAFARGANYYVRLTTKNSTTILKARHVGN